MLGVIEDDDVVSELEEVLSDDELVEELVVLFEQDDEGIDPSCSGWGVDVLARETPSVIVVQGV